jgi:hypothetical protein
MASGVYYSITKQRLLPVFGEKGRNYFPFLSSRLANIVFV